MKNLAVFASGNGGNFEAIVNACVSGYIDARVVLLVCDNEDAFAVTRAERLNVPVFLSTPSAMGGKAAYEQGIVDKLLSLDVDLICLAGYMRIVGVTLYSVYEGRILNIHPSLLPDFKGAHAIDDAFRAGMTVYGVTVHFIDLTIDGGTIVMQRSFEYKGRDRLELEARVHEVEHLLYPQAVKRVLCGF